MRKVVLGIVLIALLAVPGPATAEMIGAVMPNRNIAHFMAVHESLVAELKAMGHDVEVVLQKPAPSEMAWKNATRKLTILGSQVIVAYGSGTALAIASEKVDVPVIYNCLCDPKKHGVEGNITGAIAPVPIDELINNLRKISNFKKLAIFYTDDEAVTVMQMELAASLAEKAGAQVMKISTHDFESLTFDGADAAFLTASSHINNEDAIISIVEKAMAEKVATASVLSGTCEQGVLISMSADPVLQGKTAAKMVAAVLEGKSPQDIPPDTAPKIETTINLKTAKDLGISIPFDLLGTAKVVK